MLPLSFYIVIRAKPSDHGRPCDARNYGRKCNLPYKENDTERTAQDEENVQIWQLLFECSTEEASK